VCWTDINIGIVLVTGRVVCNDNHQNTINMVPFEFLYGQPCQMPSSWDQLEDGVLVGPEAIQELKEQLQKIQKGMEEA
jgi:hypothetical protein